jgi:hypothetical protein
MDKINMRVAGVVSMLEKRDPKWFFGCSHRITLLVQGRTLLGSMYSKNPL